MTPQRKRRSKTEPKEWARGSCLCGAVEVEIGVPARWAWHDHSRESRVAHGAAYATYVGCWKSRFRIVKGEADIARYGAPAEKVEAGFSQAGATPKKGRVRSFCKRCGTPIAYERSDPNMVNVPRALFSGRTGREPLYHVGITELADWTWLGERLVPLKGFPGVFWTRAKPKRRDVL
ncbi:MAG: GFA family protein [Parvularculaceae bacterium]